MSTERTCASVEPLARIGEPTRFHGYFSVLALVSLAYQIEPTRIVDGPDWTRSDRFEITAVNSSPRQPGDLQLMLRHLLEDRFGFQTHRAERPMPVYALETSRSDGRLGPDLRRVDRDCSVPSSVNRCSLWFAVGGYGANGQLWGEFVRNLERMAGRPLIDRTELSGQFDIELEWNPLIARLPNGIIDGPTLEELEDRPILSTAVQEQLGLKLESTTAPVEVLVIDRVERPMPD